MYKVSIIVPCYNSEEYIEQSLSSALTQTYPNVEVIFVDNESTDQSVEIAKRVKQKYPELIMTSAANIYPHCWDEAREVGFRMATGDWFTCLASDDYISSDYITNVVGFIKDGTKNGHNMKVLQSGLLCALNGKAVRHLYHLYHNKDQLKRGLVNYCCVTSPSVFYHRSLYDKGALKTYPEKYSGSADYDLYCSLVDRGLFIYTHTFWLGYTYRLHDKQATNLMENQVAIDEDIRKKWGKKWELR